MKYYAIADTHGRFDLLKLALDKIDEDDPDHEGQVITLGDYVDRGPESKHIIEQLMARPDIIALQGNHESMMVESITKPLNPDWWLGNGGDATLLSYGHPYDFGKNTSYAYVPEEHVKWLASLPKYYETEKQVFVHAGIPQWGMNLPFTSKQAHKIVDMEEKMQWMIYQPNDSGGWKGKHVVHGHHQYEDGPHTWHDEKNGGRTNLDTFAWKTGRLVVGVFDDTQLGPTDFIEVKDEKS